MEEALPFLPQQESGWDEIGGALSLAMNVVMDGKGSVRRRPGVASYITGDPVVDSKGIVGLHVASGGVVYAVSAGAGKSIYRCAPSGATKIGSVVGAGRPTFAETQSLLVVAAGAMIRKITLANDTVADLGGNPPMTTHVAAQSSRLLAVELGADLRNNFHFSGTQAGVGITGFEQWNGVGNSGTSTAGARPDSLVALHEDTNEVFCFGETNLQVFAPDPVTQYTPLQTREFGCIAPYSVIKDDQSFAWIDHARRVVHSDGRSAALLSDPIKQDLEDAQGVETAFGLRLLHGVTDALAWTFPADGRTFVFQRGAAWGQWSTLNSSNNWDPYPVTASVQNPYTGENLVGLSDGRIGVLSAAASTDLGLDIPAFVRSGFIDHDTPKVKTCNGLLLVFRRGESSAQAEAVLRWRDDLGAFGPPVKLSLGSSSDRETVVRLWSLGAYRSRQWELSFMGPESFVLAKAVEDFEVEEQ